MNIKVGIVMGLLIVMMSGECFGRRVSMENRTGKNLTFSSAPTFCKNQTIVAGTTGTISCSPDYVNDGIKYTLAYSYSIGAGNNNNLYIIENASFNNKDAAHYPRYCIKSTAESGLSCGAGL